MVEHLIDRPPNVWDAMQSGEVRFIVLLNDRHYQRGDLIKIRKVDYDSTNYVINHAVSRFSTFDLTFKLGWMLQGGSSGIDSKYAVFQLEEINEPTRGLSSELLQQLWDEAYEKFPGGKEALEWLSISAGLRVGKIEVES